MSSMGKLKSGAVTDEQGRMRLHGAFTGGFSAGYFNSVGTVEGFQPSTFVSSRANRADKVTRTAKDYMEESDESEDSEEEVVDEMLVKTGLVAEEEVDGIHSKRLSNTKLASSKDFQNSDFSLLGMDRKKDVTTKSKRDVYQVGDLFHKDMAIGDITDSAVPSVHSTMRSSEVNKKRQHQKALSAPPTSLFSSQGYSFEEGADNVYNNDRDEHAMYTTKEVLAGRSKRLQQVAYSSGSEDEDDDELGQVGGFKKQRILSKISDNIDKWLDDTVSGHKAPAKMLSSGKKKPGKGVSFADMYGEDGEDTEEFVPQFIAPKVGIPPAAAKSTEATNSNLDLKPRLYGPSSVPDTALSEPAPAPSGSIFDMMRPDAKLRLHQTLHDKVAVSSAGPGSVVLDKLSESIVGDIKGASAAEILAAAVHQERYGRDKESTTAVEQLPAEVVTESATVSTAQSTVGSERPMLATGFKLDSTFFGLHEAFKNRFTSASSTASVQQDSIVKEGMATAEEYLQMKQQRENEAASAAVIAALEASAKTGDPAQVADSAQQGGAAGKVGRSRVKSIRTVALWAPAPLLCKRYNIKVPEISTDKSFLSEPARSGIDTMLDLIQKPTDTSYTVLSTGNAAPPVRTRGKGAKGGDKVKKESESKTATSAAPVLKDTSTAPAQQGVAHLLKNRFAPSTSTVAVAETVPASGTAEASKLPVPFTINCTTANSSKSNDSSSSSSSSKKAKDSSGGFLGDDMFARLHNISGGDGGSAGREAITAVLDRSGSAGTESERVATTETVAALSTEPPKTSLFKSIFADSSSEDEGDDEDGAEVVETTAEAAPRPAAEAPAPEVNSSLAKLMNRYGATSHASAAEGVSSSTASAPAESGSIAMDISEEQLAAGPMFISRKQRVAGTGCGAGGAVGVSGKVVLGGAAVKQRAHGRKASSVSANKKSFSMYDDEDDEEQEQALSVSLERKVAEAVGEAANEKESTVVAKLAEVEAAPSASSESNTSATEVHSVDLSDVHPIITASESTKNVENKISGVDLPADALPSAVSRTAVNSVESTGASAKANYDDEEDDSAAAAATKRRRFQLADKRRAFVAPPPPPPSVPTVPTVPTPVAVAASQVVASLSSEVEELLGPVLSRPLQVVREESASLEQRASAPSSLIGTKRSLEPTSMAEQSHATESKNNHAHSEFSASEGSANRARNELAESSLLQFLSRNPEPSRPSQPQQNTIKQSHSLSAPSTQRPQPAQQSGMGRGRDNVLPAWMTSDQSSVGQRPPPQVPQPPLQPSPAHSSVSASTPSVGGGRGRASVLPAWMTESSKSSDATHHRSPGPHQSTSLPPTRPAQPHANMSVNHAIPQAGGRGRGNVLPAWMTEQNRSNNATHQPPTHVNQSVHQQEQQQHNGQRTRRSEHNQHVHNKQSSDDIDDFLLNRQPTYGCCVVGEDAFVPARPVGRGRANVLPAWMTAGGSSTSNRRDGPEESLGSDDPRFRDAPSGGVPQQYSSAVRLLSQQLSSSGAGEDERSKKRKRDKDDRDSKSDKKSHKKHSSRSSGDKHKKEKKEKKEKKSKKSHKSSHKSSHSREDGSSKKAKRDRASSSSSSSSGSGSDSDAL